MRSRRVGLKGVLEVPEKEFNTVIQATTGHYDYRQRGNDSTLWNDGGSCQGVDSGSLLSNPRMKHENPPNATMSSEPQPKPKRKYKPRSAVYDPCTVRPYNRYNIFFIVSLRDLWLLAPRFYLAADVERALPNSLSVSSRSRATQTADHPSRDSRTLSRGLRISIYPTSCLLATLISSCRAGGICPRGTCPASTTRVMA